MGWFFKSKTEKKIEKLGLTPSFFKKLGFPGEYALLVKSLRKLDDKESKEAQLFIEQAYSYTLNYDSVFDELSDNQTMVMLATINAAAEETSGLGPNARAHAILFYTKNLNVMLAELKKDMAAGQQAIIEMRNTLKRYYKKTQEECIAQKDITNTRYHELNGLLGDVRYKFIIPDKF